MSKIKRILAAAATLVTGSAMALGLALWTANQDEVTPLTCRQFTQALSRVAQQRGEVFFVAIQDGFSVPAAVGSRILGDCAAGQCVVQSDNCAASLVYPYAISPLVNGWRLARADAPMAFGLGWKQLAADNAEVRFYRNFANVKTDCLANFTAAQCRDLIDGVARCWWRPDGQLCRGTDPGAWGLYGPGEGGATPCTPQVDDVPYPCGDGARGSNWVANVLTADLPSDADMELP